MEMVSNLLETTVQIKLTYLTGCVKSHPHNYVMEILNDTGIIGLFLIYSLVIYLIFSNYKDYIRNDSFKPLISNWIYLAIIFSVFINFFPFKSTGSFFFNF